MAKTTRKNKHWMKEVLEYMWVNRIWWIAPIVIMLILTAILIFFAQQTAVSPFVYALF
jgi:hypothetical protein